MSENNLVQIGSFKVSSGKLYISDPCYNRNTNIEDPLCAIIDNVPNGKWNAQVAYNGEGRVEALIAVCDDLSAEPGDTDIVDWLCVDSGQLGIFDEAKFPQGETGDYGDEKTFYGKCCAKSLGEKSAGIVGRYGVVSTSGYGDGCYHACISRDVNGLARYVAVYFICDEEEDKDSSDLN